MPLHLLKLCVGAESIKDLEDWVAERQGERRRRKEAAEHIHTTRMVPKRIAELRDGGSLYWVIKGQVAARQTLIDVRPFIDGEGISRCHLVMQPEVVPVLPRPFRPFQGWRYMTAADAPRDIAGMAGEIGEMPEVLRRELRDMGLI